MKEQQSNKDDINSGMNTVESRYNQCSQDETFKKTASISFRKLKQFLSENSYDNRFYQSSSSAQVLQNDTQLRNLEIIKQIYDQDDTQRDLKHQKKSKQNQTIIQYNYKYKQEQPVISEFQISSIKINNIKRNLNKNIQKKTQFENNQITYNQVNHYKIIKIVQNTLKNMHQIGQIKQQKPEKLKIQQLFMLFFFIGCIKQTNPNNSFDLIAYKYFELIKKLCKVYDIQSTDGFLVKNIINFLCLLQKNIKPNNNVSILLRNDFGYFNQQGIFYPSDPSSLRKQFLELAIKDKKIPIKCSMKQLASIIKKNLKNYITTQMKQQKNMYKLPHPLSLINNINIIIK